MVKILFCIQLLFAGILGSLHSAEHLDFSDHDADCIVCVLKKSVANVPDISPIILKRVFLTSNYISTGNEQNSYHFHLTLFARGPPRLGIFNLDPYIVRTHLHG